MPPLIELIARVVVAVVYIFGCSRIGEPSRRHLNSIMIGGTGAAYLNGGLGIWELAFNSVITFLAFKGLQDYRYTGAGWVLHTIWDGVNHRLGSPNVPIAAMSYLGCVIRDLLLAVWCFAGWPSIQEIKTRAIASRA